jgi:hypothetical protein
MIHGSKHVHGYNTGEMVKITQYSSAIFNSNTYSFHSQYSYSETLCSNLKELFDFDHWKLPLKRVYSLKMSHNENRLNQYRENLFMPRKCAHSISRLGNHWTIGFPAKARFLVHFRFSTSNPFPESGPEKHVYGSTMRAIDSRLKKPRRSQFCKDLSQCPKDGKL